MKQLQKWILAPLLFSFIFGTVNGQEFFYEEPVGEAYAQSSHSTHWSVYIPISILVAGAIYFGMADGKQHEGNSSNTKDGLGSMINSKRIGGKNLSNKHSKPSPPYSRSGGGGHSHS